jgi:hypothetical protein
MHGPYNITFRHFMALRKTDNNIKSPLVSIRKVSTARNITFFIFSVAQQPISVLGRLLVELSREHRHATFGRAPLDEGSARFRGHYLHNT